MTTIHVISGSVQTNYPPPDYDSATVQGNNAWVSPDEMTITTAQASVIVEGNNAWTSPDTMTTAQTSDDRWSNAEEPFGEKKIRHAFIRKVYLILMLQLMLTAGIICLFLFCEPVKRWVQTNSWFYWTSYGVFIATYIVLACCSDVRRRVPANYICLVIFTLAMSNMTGTISSYYDTDIVLIAMGITCALCLGITLFAIQTKIDFTLCYGLMLALCLVLLFSGTLCLILWLCGYTYLSNVLYGGIAALVFSMFLVFDTQRVVGGKNRRNSLSPEEYVMGALELYMDIVYLFILIVTCSGR